MKNKLFILGVLLPLVCCSCGQTFSWDSYVNDSYNMSLESSKLKNYKTYTNYNEMNERKNELTSVIENKGSVSKFNSLINTVYGDYAKTLNSLTKIEVDYYADPSNTNKTKYENQYDFYLSFYQYLLNLEEKIASSSQEIKRAYFGNMTDEEIDKEVQMSNNRSEAAIYEGQMTKISDEMDLLYNEYNGQGQVYVDLTYDKYLKYIDLGNQIRDIFDEDSYLDYVYKDSYYRDYSVEDTLQFCKFVKKYLVPIYIFNKELKQPKGLSNQFLKKFEKYNLCNRESGGYKLYKDYAEELGGSYLTKYNTLWRDGYYKFTDNADSLGTAFVTVFYDENFNTEAGVAYFSAGYQNVMTIVHEFGHYYAETQNDLNNDVAYDVKETHSQGDECTFLNYLVTKHSNDDHSKEYQFFADSTLYNYLWYIINESCIAEIEAFAFSQENLTKSTLKAGVESIISSYRGGANDYYWCYPCVGACGYYISYATSALESAQFYHMDFDVAKTTYMSLVENPVANSVVSSFTNAGLTSPFEEQTFIDAAAMYNAMVEKYK